MVIVPRTWLPVTDARLGTVLFAWLVFRTLVWTVVTWATQPNAPLDAVEMLSWGRDWQWGYPKHPPLPAWIAQAAWVIDGGTLWGVYFAGYAMIAAAVWGVWRLALRMVQPRDALLAALCLEGVVFYTFWGHELNHNVALTTFWVLTALFLYRAVEADRWRDWCLTGVCAGLGLLAKYSLVFLLVPLLVWMLVEPCARRSWRRSGPYVAVLVMLVVFGPHLVWAGQHGWPALTYARDRAAVPTGAWTRVVQPISFLANQGLALIPLAGALLWGLSRRARALTDGERFAVRYLLAIVFGPLALYLLLSVAMGAQLKGPWGTPIWAGFGLLAVVVWRVREVGGVRRRMAVALVGCNLAALAFLVAQALVPPVLGTKLSRIHFTGKDLAASADRAWRERYSGAIPAIDGDQWLAGNVGLYAPDDPACATARNATKHTFAATVASSSGTPQGRCGACRPRCPSGTPPLSKSNWFNSRTNRC